MSSTQRSTARRPASVHNTAMGQSGAAVDTNQRAKATRIYYHTTRRATCRRACWCSYNARKHENNMGWHESGGTRRHFPYRDRGLSIFLSFFVIDGRQTTTVLVWDACGLMYVTVYLVRLTGARLSLTDRFLTGTRYQALFFYVRFI